MTEKQGHGGNNMKPELLENIRLKSGATSPNDREMCVMEAVAYVAGEPWSDSPECASKVIAAFCRAWNDRLDDDTRQRLKPYAPKLVGTAKGAATETKLAWLATDWLARVYAPAWMDLSVTLKPNAAKLRALPELTPKTAKRAQKTLNAARAAAWDAAEDADWDADWDAAWTAAWTAARAAAWAAAMAAAMAAAGDAAWTAARAAARAAAAVGVDLAPTGKEIQRSAFELLDRMISVAKNEGF